MYSSDITFQFVIIRHSYSDAVEKQGGINQDSYQILLPYSKYLFRSVFLPFNELSLYSAHDFTFQFVIICSSVLRSNAVIIISVINL